MASMNVYWEDELIGKRTSGGRKLVFVPNLQVFVHNNKERYHFEKVSRSSDGQFFSATCGDTEWRQVKGILKKEDLVKFLNALKKGEYRSMLNYNLSRSCYNLVCSRVKKELGLKHIFQYHYDPIHKHKELYAGFLKACRTGYSFNNCDPNVIYTNVHQVDVNSFYSYIMRNYEMPVDFLKGKAKDIEKMVMDNMTDYNWFSYVGLKIKRFDEFLHRNEFHFTNFRQEKNIVYCWINNFDYMFIDQLCGIEGIAFDPDRFWWVKLDYLENYKPSITHFIDICYKHKMEDGLDRFIWKGALERLYGKCLEKKYYRKNYIWNTDEQQFNLEVKPDCKFEDIDFRGYFEMGWGIWTTSYARLLLLKKKKELEEAGCVPLYGDVDSLKYQGDFQFNISEELGRWKDEGTLKTFKVLGKKWYAGYLENGECKLACSGADKDVVKQLIDDKGLENLKSTSLFPSGYNPFVKYIETIDGKLQKTYCGSFTLKDASAPNLRISACAGSGKTTRLLMEAKRILDKTTDDVILVAFTNAMVNELKKRIGTKDSRLTICTVDSLANQLTERCYQGKFEAALKAATELLISADKAAKQIVKNTIPNKVHLLVDEAQDLTTERINFLLALPAIDRIFVGDPNQSIFKYDGTVSIFDVDLPNTTDETMNTNYRCPQVINDFAEGFLPENMRPHAECTSEKIGEILFPRELTPEFVSKFDIVLCRTNDELDFIKSHFSFVEATTIHKAKGLQFKSVLVIGVNKPTEKLEEQYVSYVMATRATEKLAIYNAYLEGLDE